MAAKKNMHPNSLKNLDPGKTFSKDNELARMAQKKGVETKLRRKAEREALKSLIADFGDTAKEVIRESEVSALDVLRLSMMKAIENEDFDTAADLANKIAPYEAPKLQAIEQTNKEIGADELTDEELDERLRKILGKEGESSSDGGDPSGT